MAIHRKEMNISWNNDYGKRGKWRRRETR